MFIAFIGTNNAKAVSVVIEITRQFENPAHSKDDDLVAVIDIYRVGLQSFDKYKASNDISQCTC